MSATAMPKVGLNRTGRGVVRIVARREFVERARDRSFAISTGVTVLILVGFIVVNAAFNRGTQFELGLVGESSAPVGTAAVAASKAQGATVTVHTFSTRAAAERALRSGAVDGVVVNGGAIEVKSQPRADLVGIVQAASAQARVRAAVQQLGLTPEQAAQLLSPRPLPVRALVPPKPHRQSNVTVAFVGVLLLYGQLFGYGVAVASGVVEEKSSRVIELLLSAIRPSQLLAGKVLGIGALGLLQLLFIGTVGLVTAELAGRLAFPSGALGIAAVVLMFFVLGFAFYSTLFAVAGATVPRQEELQNAITPLSLVIVVSFFVSFGALSDASSTVATVASFIPFSAPLTMPLRVANGVAPPWEVLASVAIMVACTLALIPLAARLYSGAVLRTGSKVRLREVWRATADRPSS